MFMHEIMYSFKVYLAEDHLQIANYTMLFTLYEKTSPHMSIES